MKVEDLVKLNLDELEQELDSGSYSKSFLESAMAAEKADENRKGAIKLIEDAIELAEVEPAPEVIGAEQSLATSGEIYVVAGGLAIGFKAGIKSDGDIVDPNWPEFKANPELMSDLIRNGLVVKK